MFHTELTHTPTHLPSKSPATFGSIFTHLKWSDPYNIVPVVVLTHFKPIFNKKNRVLWFLSIKKLFLDLRKRLLGPIFRRKRVFWGLYNNFLKEKTQFFCKKWAHIVLKHNLLIFDKDLCTIRVLKYNTKSRVFLYFSYSSLTHTPSPCLGLYCACSAGKKDY